jgi:3-oxoadipate enol-lactonase
METAAVNGQQIAFDDTRGPGTPVVLAHGFFMDRSMFAAQVAALRDEYRVITWDQRGFGDTVDDGQEFSYWDSARDCLGLLDHLGIDRAVLGGMSQGGFVSLRCALEAPERVAGLVLLDTQAGVEAPERLVLYREMLDTWLAGGPTPEIAEVVASLILGDPVLSKAWVARWLTMGVGEGGPASRALLERDDITDRLGEIRTPALVVHGTADAAIPMDRAEALADGLPGCLGVIAVQDGTHASNLTHPGAVNDAIVTFLDGLRG